MTPDRIRAHPVSLGGARVPSLLGSWLAPFGDCFTAPVWQRVLILLAGAVLAPGQRTVSAALRVMGLADQPGFGRFHEVLRQARWNSHALARRLLNICSTACCRPARW